MKKSALLLALLACFSSALTAQTVQECGGAAVNVCTGASYPNGINYYPNRTTSITLDNPDMLVETTGVLVGPSMVYAAVASTTLSANRFKLVSSTAPGVIGRGMMSTNRGPATVVVTGGEVKTVGAPNSSGEAIAILAEVLGPSSASALVTVNGTKVSTTGAGAKGIMSYTGFGGVATGGARIEATDIVLTTSGDGAQGLLAAGYAGNLGPMDIILISGTVDTQGAKAPAAHAYTQGGAITVDVQAGGHLTANGLDASGILAEGPVSANVTVKNAGHIKSAQSDGINLSAALHGGTITSSGNISGATAAVRGSPAVDSFVASGGAIVGVTLMDGGNDIVTLQNPVDVSAAPQFDGGAGTDTLNIDGLTLRGFTAAANNQALGSNLTLWEVIDVKNAGTLKLNGNLFEAANTGELKLSTATSALDVQDAATSTSTVNGNFDSVGQLKLDTVVGDSSSASDVLHFTGNTTGATVVQINNLGGPGALTTGNGILLVRVDGSSTGTFTLPGDSLVVGQYVYTLKQVGNDWYLQSQSNVGSVTVKKLVDGPADAPAFSGNVPFTLNCASPSFSQPGVIAVSGNQGSAAPITVVVGSTCSVAEGVPDAPPAGYHWGTTTLPATGLPMQADGSQTLTIVNSLVKDLPKTGLLQVSKIVQVPADAAPYNGTIDFSVACTNPAFTMTGNVTVSNNQGNAAPITVQAGSQCVVTETLPAAPAGMEWATPVYSQPGVITENMTATASMTNVLNKKDVAAAVPVPTLNQWALLLLSIALAGFAAFGLQRARVK